MGKLYNYVCNKSQLELFCEKLGIDFDSLIYVDNVNDLFEEQVIYTTEKKLFKKRREIPIGFHTVVTDYYKILTTPLVIPLHELPTDELIIWLERRVYDKDEKPLFFLVDEDSLNKFKDMTSFECRVNFFEA